MKKIIPILLINFIHTQCYAQNILKSGETGSRQQTSNVTPQQKDSITIYKDTIDLRGIIYETDGKPAKNIEIGLLQNEFHPNGYPTITKTDSTGYFELKGAKPYDTIRIVDIRYIYFPFPNKGSRFMVIYLPPPKTVEINSSSPIEVKASRKYPKKMPAFRIEIKDPIFDEGCLSSIQYPEFIGGLNKFIDYIRRGIVYPEKAISNNIEGTVQIAFTIEKDGSIGAVNVIMGIGYGCDEQIVRLIKNAPRWRPGILCGRPFSIQETVSIKFTLTDK